jgi:hypothetical protein
VVAVVVVAAVVLMVLRALVLPCSVVVVLPASVVVLPAIVVVVVVSTSLMKVGSGVAQRLRIGVGHTDTCWRRPAPTAPPPLAEGVARTHHSWGDHFDAL